MDGTNAGREAREKLLEILRPYGSQWSGAIARGDLVIPQRDIPKVVREITEAFQNVGPQPEATERDVFLALKEAGRLQSVQAQAAFLTKRFCVFAREA